MRFSFFGHEASDGLNSVVAMQNLYCGPHVTNLHTYVILDNDRSLKVIDLML